MDKKKLKIVFLSRYVGKVNRGVESHVLELTKRLKNNYEVDIFRGSDADSLKKILDGNYDLVIPTNGRVQALKASFGRILGSYKTLIAGHAGVGRDEIWNIFVTAPDVYVALTGFEKKWAQKWAWKSKIIKIPNGIDLNKFSPNGQKIKIDLSPPIILSVGELVWYKYHELTIKALARLDKGSLIIIGSGPDREKLLAMGKKLLGDERFKIVSADYHQMPAYYRSADLFVLPSWNREAFGIAYLEAMASGLGVVAPDDSSRLEIIGNAGILTNVFNIEDYSKAIAQALEIDWKGIALAQANKFSWEKVARGYEKLIQKEFS